MKLNAIINTVYISMAWCRMGYVFMAWYLVKHRDNFTFYPY